MLYKRQIMAIALVVALAAGWAGTETRPSQQQSATAVKLLLQAQLQFQNMDFVAARETLWKAYQRREELTGPQRMMLADRLGEVDRAIQQQVIAKAVYNMAVKASREGDWALARDSFTKAAECPYLPLNLRSRAKQQLAAVEVKLADSLARRTEPTPRPEQGEDIQPTVVMAAPPLPDSTAPEQPTAVQPIDPNGQPEVSDEPAAVLSEVTVPPIETPGEETTAPAPQGELALAEASETAPHETQIAQAAPPRSDEQAVEEELIDDAAQAADDEQAAMEEVAADADPVEVDERFIMPADNKTPADNDVPVQTDVVQEPAVQQPNQTMAVETEPAARDDALSAMQARQIKVDMLVAQGRDALNKNQPEQAVESFSRALQLDPDNAQARRMLEFARQQTAQPGDAGILSDVLRQRRIAKQIAQQDIHEALNRSKELMADPDSREDFQAALQAAQVAKTTLQNNKALFSATQYRQRLASINDQIRWVEDKRQEWDERQVRLTMREIEEASRQRQLQAEQRRSEKISELTNRAHTLRSQNNYQGALRVMRQIVELDPDNSWARENIPVLTQFILLQEQKNMTDARNVEIAKQTADIRASEIPWFDKLRYPRDWVDLTERRQRFGAGVAADSEEDRRVRQKLNQVIDKVKLVDVKFEDAIEYLREVSGANIYVNWGTLELEIPDVRSKQVNVILDDVSAETALRHILKEAGGGEIQLGYVISEGVINVSTQRMLSMEVYPRVYDIRDLLVRVPNFVGPRIQLDAIGDVSGDTDSGTGTSSSSSSSDGLFGDDEEDVETGREAEALTKAEMVGILVSMIKSTVDRESWYPAGNGEIQEINGNLVITQTARNHRLVGDLISKIREARTIQVAIEARFITVNSGFLSQIGVDLDFYFNIGSQIGGPATTNPLTGAPFATPPQGQVTDPYTGAAVPLRRASAWNQAGNNADASFSKWSPISVGQSSNTFANVFGSSTNVPNGIGSLVSAPAMSIAGTFLDDLQVDFLIQATQAHSGTRTLTAPRVTLFSGQRAYVSIARQQAYISGVEPIVSENAVALRPIVSYAPTGTLLDVDAVVSHDRRYVTLTLRPQIMTLNGDIQQDPAGFGVGLPNITLQDIQTTVSVPDGGTLLIGGQKLAGEVEREMGVPVVSKLPVINRAFTNKGKLRDEETLLILIKPQIIINDEMEMNPELRKARPTFQEGLSSF